jgi:hypothetical protein
MKTMRMMPKIISTKRIFKKMETLGAAEHQTH